MINIAALIDASQAKKEWYQAKLDTSDLIQKVVSCLHVGGLSSDDLWYLFRLTWGTPRKKKDHWRKLKAPALAHLFGKQYQEHSDLRSTIMAMQLPDAVTAAAVRSTAVVHFYSARWNSSRDPWCVSNAGALRQIIQDARNLGQNVQDRFALAAKIELLPPVPLPNGGRGQHAADLVTPLVACLDSDKLFPIINGRTTVQRLLRSMHVVDHGLESQVNHVTGLIGHYGISDAHMIDVCADEIVDAIKKGEIETQPESKGPKPVPIPYYDEDERLSTKESGTIVSQQRHNRITNALRLLFANPEPEQGNDPNCRYDALLKNYDQIGRDLLIEVKPDPDKGSLRIAIGQLFDYRRFLPHRPATDLAVLTIGPPDQSYKDLLADLQITCLWFDQDCTKLDGEGKAWKALAARLGLGPIVNKVTA
jgi:hypothetical protein